MLSECKTEMITGLTLAEIQNIQLVHHLETILHVGDDRVLMCIYFHKALWSENIALHITFSNCINDAIC